MLASRYTLSFPPIPPLSFSTTCPRTQPHAIRAHILPAAGKCINPFRSSFDRRRKLNLRGWFFFLTSFFTQRVYEFLSDQRLAFSSFLGENIIDTSNSKSFRSNNIIDTSNLKSLRSNKICAIILSQPRFKAWDFYFNNRIHIRIFFIKDLLASYHRD